MAYLQQVNKSTRLQQGCAPYGSLATRLCAIWLTCNKAVRHMAHLHKDVCHMAHLQQGATKCFAFASGFVDSPPFFNL